MLLPKSYADITIDHRSVIHTYLSEKSKQIVNANKQKNKNNNSKTSLNFYII